MASATLSITTCLAMGEKHYAKHYEERKKKKKIEKQQKKKSLISVISAQGEKAIKATENRRINVSSDSDGPSLLNEGETSNATTREPSFTKTFKEDQHTQAPPTQKSLQKRRKK